MNQQKKAEQILEALTGQGHLMSVDFKIEVRDGFIIIEPKQLSYQKILDDIAHLNFESTVTEPNNEIYLH